MGGGAQGGREAVPWFGLQHGGGSENGGVGAGGGRYVDCPAAGDRVERWSTFSSAARGPSIGNRDLLMVDNEREGVQLHALPLTALLRREATPPGRLGDAASVSAASVTSRVLRSQPITESTSALASFWTCAKCSAPLNDSA